MTKINYGEFKIVNDEEVYIKHCNFNKAILWITKELSIALTVFEDIKKRNIKKLYFVNTNPEGDLAGIAWVFNFDWVDENKREIKRFQETQYYFDISSKLGEVKNGE